MLLQSLYRQADFLRQRESSAEIDKIEKSVALQLGSIVEKTTLPPGLTGIITMVLCYAGVRHSHWINTPIFREILIHYIKTDYRIESSTTAILVDTVLREMRSTRELKPSHIDNSDFEFLKYIFIIAATADNEASLVSDMGLGSEIIYKMKSTLQLVMTDPAAVEKKPQVFFSDLDAQIYEIMIEVSKDIRRYAWSIHVDKLRYMMIEATDPVSSLIAKFSARWVFETLLAIGSKKIVSSNQIYQRLQKTLVTSGTPCSEQQIYLILAQLRQLNLIFPVETTRNSDTNFKWELTNEAAHLTADAFALTHINAQKNPLSHFRDLNRFYQDSLLKHLGEDSASDVKVLISDNTPLAPEVLKSAFRYLGRFSDNRSLIEFIKQVKISAVSTWSQKAIDRALIDSGVLEIVHTVDNSPI
jgi:hypothetical protein